MTWFGVFLVLICLSSVVIEKYRKTISYTCFFILNEAGCCDLVLQYTIGGRLAASRSLPPFGSVHYVDLRTLEHCCDRGSSLGFLLSEIFFSFVPWY
jgi:hypothetical protein